MIKKLGLPICITVAIASCTQDTTTEPPANGPGGVTFIDSDTTGSLGGPITITRAPDESDIASYNIKWGGSGNCSIVASPIGSVDTTGQGDIVFNLPAGTTQPSGATKILVFSANLGGENPDCASDDIVPVGGGGGTQVPTNGPAGVSFTDTDTTADLGGPIEITRAADESDITSYILKWGGAGTCAAIGSPIGEVNTSGQGNILFNLPAGTSQPNGATKILAFSANAVGENADCASDDIVPVGGGGTGQATVMIKHGNLSNRCFREFNDVVRLSLDCNASDSSYLWEMTGSGNNFQLRSMSSNGCMEYDANNNEFITTTCSSSELQVINFGSTATNFYTIGNTSSAGQVCIEGTSSSFLTVTSNCSGGSDGQWEVLLDATTPINFPFNP